MAEELGINCIIEGVEIQQQADHFRQKGVYGIQGYFYYKPVSGEELLNILNSSEKTEHETFSLNACRKSS